MADRKKSSPKPTTYMCSSCKKAIEKSSITAKIPKNDKGYKFTCAECAEDGQPGFEEKAAMWCHQCKLKHPFADVFECTCAKRYCKKCTARHYGVTEENITADWKCPFCSKICTCALCRKKRPNPDKIVREKDGRAVVRSSRLQEKRRTETQQKAKYGAKGKGKKRKAEGESDGRVAKRKRFSDDEESCDGGPISFDEQENISEEDGFEVEASPKGMGNKKVKGTLSGRSNGNKPQNLSRFFTTAKTQASALELKTEPPGIFPKTVPDSLFLIGVLANQAREFLKDNNLLTPVINISLDTIQLCNDNVIASLCLEDEQLSQSQEEKGNDAQQDTPIMANIV